MFIRQLLPRTMITPKISPASLNERRKQPTQEAAAKSRPCQQDGRREWPTYYTFQSSRTGHTMRRLNPALPCTGPSGTHAAANSTRRKQIAASRPARQPVTTPSGCDQSPRIRHQRRNTQDRGGPDASATNRCCGILLRTSRDSRVAATYHLAGNSCPFQPAPPQSPIKPAPKGFALATAIPGPGQHSQAGADPKNQRGQASVGPSTNHATSDN